MCLLLLKSSNIIKVLFLGLVIQLIFYILDCKTPTVYMNATCNMWITDNTIVVLIKFIKPIFWIFFFFKLTYCGIASKITSRSVDHKFDYIVLLVRIASHICHIVPLTMPHIYYFVIYVYRVYYFSNDTLSIYQINDFYFTLINYM